MSHVMKRPRQPAMQLYRPNDDTLTQEAELLLQRTDLLEQDVLDFLRGAPRRASVGTSQINETLRQQFRERRGEIRRLKEDLRSGRAMIDEDDRLVPLSTPLPRTRQPLPNLPQVINIDQHEEQLVEQERRETTEAITRAVAQYREQGVPEEEFELIMVPLRPPPQNLIFSAFVAVVSAFTIAILLALPSMISHDALEPFFDKLMYELVHVRHFDSHLAHCPGLQRNPSQSLKGQVLQKFGLLWDEDCGDGVLHIPARHVALDKYLQASTKKSAELLRPFKEGFNVSWTLPCDSTRVADPHQCRATDVDECVIDSSSRAKCFRGVHDNVLSVKDTTDVLLFGNFLVQQQGSDNFNVFYATHLERKLPEVMQKLKLLLHERYDLSELEPLIFRITSTGPADGYGVDPHSMALNQTVYFDLVEKNKRVNEMAYYSLPWPFHKKPNRDTCLLISDKEVDPLFSLHTSIFLGTGAGKDYRGGSTLFMDDHVSNYNHYDRVRRGVSIDGSRGRVVVSTSGLENRRCRLPVRAGLRTELQIWWDASTE